MYDVKCITLPDSVGMCDTSKLQIFLDIDSPKSKQAEALLHEIFEVLSDHLDLKLDHQTLSTLSETLFAVIRTNDINFSGVE